MIIKTLSRFLNIQVSFNETTLFTPRRCFERAVKKCFDDFFSSIVASCSWGKRMDVGIGSRSDVPGEEVDDLIEMDTYNFLYMVNSGGGTNSNTVCLGLEVDNLMEVDEVTNCLMILPF